MEPVYREERNAPVHERSLGDLFRELSHEFSTLVRQEKELARAEIQAKLAKIRAAAAALGAGAALAFAGLLFVMLAAAIGFAQAFGSMWVGALVVGVAALIAAAALLAQGRKQLQPEELKPTRTIESLRKDAELVRTGEAH